VPIYEYKCVRCGETFEELLRVRDPDPACPSCGAEKPRKLMSNTYFSLKGTGWYATDYARRAHASSEGSGSKEKTEHKSAQKESASPPKADGQDTPKAS